MPRASEKSMHSHTLLAGVQIGTLPEGNLESYMKT